MYHEVPSILIITDSISVQPSHHKVSADLFCERQSTGKQIAWESIAQKQLSVLLVLLVVLCWSGTCWLRLTEQFHRFTRDQIQFSFRIHWNALDSERFSPRSTAPGIGTRWSMNKTNRIRSETSTIRHPRIPMSLASTNCYYHKTRLVKS